MHFTSEQVTVTVQEELQEDRAVLHSRFHQRSMCVCVDASTALLGDHRVVVITITLMQCRRIGKK
jgi:hypothetical protein